MKKELFFLKALIVLICFTITSGSEAKNPVWFNYTCGNYVNYVALDSNYIWKATTVGLVKVDKATGDVAAYYNRLNSKLPVDNITYVAIDGMDKLWAGTGAGLAYFDGTTFTVYKQAANGLPDNSVSCLAAEGKDFLWIGTASGLAKFNLNTKQWTVYKTSNSGLAGDNISSVYIDSEGIKWIGTASGISRFDGTVWKTYSTSNSALPSNAIACIKGDKTGNILAGTIGGGLAKLSDTVWTIYNKSNSGLSDDNIKSLSIDKQNVLWVVSGNILMKFDGNVWTSTNNPNAGLSKVEFRNVIIDEEGNKWVGTKGKGIAMLAASSKKSAKSSDTIWTVFNKSVSGLPDDDVRNVAKDSKGNIWVTTSGKLFKLLSKFDGKVWKVYDLIEIYGATLQGYAELLNMTIDNKGVVYIGTDVGLIEFTGTIWNFYDYKNSPLPYARVLCLESDVYGNKWVGTMGGLVKISGKVWTVYDKKNAGFPDDWINCIAVEDASTYWIGLFWEGFVRWDGASSVAKYNSTNSKLPYDNIDYISIDTKGNKWFAALNTISMFDGFKWTVAKDLAGYVKRIAIDKSDVVYFNMEKNGFIRCRNLSMANYKMSNSGLIDDNVNGIAVDLLGNVWLATNNGLSVFNEAGINYVSVESKDYSLNNTVNISPNPANSFIVVSCSLIEKAKAGISIYDINGRLVMNKNAEIGLQNGNNSIRINTGDLSDGMYLLNVSADNYSASRKFIVKH